MATTVGPEDIRPGDLIEWLGNRLTVREVREDQPTISGMRVFRIRADLAGTLYSGTLYSGVKPILVLSPTVD